MNYQEEHSIYIFNFSLLWTKITNRNKGFNLVHSFKDSFHGCLAAWASAEQHGSYKAGQKSFSALLQRNRVRGQKQDAFQKLHPAPYILKLFSPPKAPRTSQNSATSWGPSAQHTSGLLRLIGIDKKSTGLRCEEGGKGGLKKAFHPGGGGARL